MKSFKIGFAAVLAIMTMSFTVAAHKGAFKKIHLNPKATYTCQSPNVKGFWYCKNGLSFQCTSNMLKASVPPVGTCTFVPSFQTGSYICDELPIYFCCAQLFNLCQITCAPGTTGTSILAIHYSSMAH